MSKLIRMDHTGHSTLAEWTPDDPAAVEAAVAAFRAELERGYLGDGQHRARATPSTSASCRSTPSS